MQITTPDIGVDKAVVAEILVKVGDTIAVDDSVVLLESDKASVEVPMIPLCLKSYSGLPQSLCLTQPQGCFDQRQFDRQSTPKFHQRLLFPHQCLVLAHQSLVML